ncbi:MAG TPA: ABC transporter substrate-binding protein [Symbiobacteriaceae bacterium]|nr:ABC transporter substrate-binding protein [Symbiobacteriaceae bacterium]
MFQNKLRKVLAVSVLMAVMAGCSSSKPAAETAPAATPAKEPIKIGVVTSLTGANAATGVQVSTGAKLAIKEWNAKGGIQGQQIEVLVEDDQSNPTGATNAFNKIAAAKPAGMVLPTFAPFVMALEPAVRQLGVPSLTSATGVAITKQGNPWFFRTRTNDEIMGKIAANFAADELKTKKPGLLYANNDYGKGGFGVIKATLEAKGIPLAATETFNQGDKDMTAQLLNLKKAGVDLIIVWSIPADSATIAVQQKQLGLGVQILGSPGWGTKEFFDLAKGAADGQYGLVDYAGGSTDRIKAWEKAVDENFKGIPASFVTGAAYDGTNIMLSAMNKVGTDPAKVREAMAATQNYDGIIGSFSFDKEGNGLRQAVIFKIENNAIKVVKTMKE